MPRLKKNTVRLPAIDVEVPRMGMVVYVSPKVGVQDKKWTTMFTAEISVNKFLELQSFHLKCANVKEAEATRDDMLKRLQKGPFPFIQTNF